MNYQHSDSTGKVPDMAMVGLEYDHPNTFTYVVTGFSWDGERDLWMVNHQRGGSSVTFTRSIDNFLERLTRR